MNDQTYHYLTLNFKNESEFIFEISSIAKEGLEEEISDANKDSPKFIAFDTCDIRRIYFCAEHLQEVTFESRPCPAEADESIGEDEIEIYTTTSSEPILISAHKGDVNDLFRHVMNDTTKFINVETTNGFQLINLDTVILAMAERELWDSIKD
jgi:hypothetical protein